MSEASMAYTGRARINFICFTAAIGGLLFGFDTAVISGAIDLVKIQYSLSPALQGWLVSSGLLGCVGGVLLCGAISDRAGRKNAMLISGFMFLLSGFGCAFALNFEMLVAFRIIGGFGVGVASVVSPMFIAEFAEARQRGRMISFYQFAITIGILLAYFSNALFVHFAAYQFSGYLHWFMNEQNWRPMFLAMTLPSVIFLFMLSRIPESPRWLFSVGMETRALDILRTVRDKAEAEKELLDMRGAKKKAQTTRLNLASPQIRLPLLIGIVLAVLQQFSGVNAIMYYGPSIFIHAGIASGNAMLFQVIIGLVNIVFTIIAIRWSDTFGRRKLLIVGLSGIIFSLSMCGMLFYIGGSHGTLLLCMMLLFMACFSFSIGPLTWVLISEIFPTEVRGRAVAICTIALWLAVFLVGQFFPWLLDKGGVAITFWMFALCSLVNLVFCVLLVRETKGTTLEEMDEVFIAPH